MAIELDDVLKILDAARSGMGGSATPPPAGAPAITKAPQPAHQGTLTPEQAAAFHMMMLIQGHTAATVGRGRVVEHPVQKSTPDPGSDPAAVANPVEGE